MIQVKIAMSSGSLIGIGSHQSMFIQIPCILFQNSLRVFWSCFKVLARRWRSKICKGSAPLPYVIDRPFYSALTVGYSVTLLIRFGSIFCIIQVKTFRSTCSHLSKLGSPATSGGGILVMCEVLPLPPMATRINRAHKGLLVQV